MALVLMVIVLLGVLCLFREPRPRGRRRRWYW